MLLKRSIPSVLNQTYKNFKLIIIGDKCTDNTKKIIESLLTSGYILKIKREKTSNTKITGLQDSLLQSTGV